MAASGLLRERDLRALTAVIEDGQRDDPGQAMPWAALDRLQQLIPCDGVQFDELDLQGHLTLTRQVVEDGGDRITEIHSDADNGARFWALREEFEPNSYSARTGDFVSVLRWSDFYTAGGLKDARFYAEYRDPSLKYCIFVPLPAGPGRTRRVGFRQKLFTPMGIDTVPAAEPVVREETCPRIIAPGSPGRPTRSESTPASATSS